MTLRAFAVFAAILISTGAVGDEYQFTKSQAVSLEPDKAYILFRISFEKFCSLVTCINVRYTPILIRTLSSEEFSQANALAQQDPDHWRARVQANVVVPSADQAYAEEGETDFLLVSLTPGTYIIGGLSASGVSAVTSLCMGTVEFEAKAGVITDLGTILSARDDKPTTIPELSNYVTGKPMGDSVIPQAVAVRPATPATEVPQTLKSVPLVAADYRAVPPFPNYMGAQLMRLAPLAGVLAYDKDGQVIDLKSGQAPAH